MRTVYAHLCDYGFVANGKPSLIGIFDRIGGQKFPLTHGPFFLAFELEIEAAEVGRKLEMEIQLRDADGKRLHALQIQMESRGTAKPGQKPRLRQVMQIPKVKFEKPGAYEFAFFVNKSFDRAVPLTVAKAKASGG